MDKLGLTEKAIGYALLTIGILIIVASGFNIYQILNKQAQVAQLFNFSGISIDLGGALSSMVPAEQQQAARSQIGDKAKQEIISSKVLNDTSNLAAHLFLVGFLATIGYKIASVGTQLIRTIKVSVREAKP